MRADLLERFKELFKGGNHAYGQWHQKGGASTVHGAVPDKAYNAHLDGEVGLGLVPINESGLCRFAAIDIDVDTIDHMALRQKVTERNLPLNVCRSKSGGAHLYLLVKDQGMPATAVQQVLQRWATVLGYPTAEIFPKQTRVNAQSIGSWINLPYFGGDATTRYAFGATGALSFEEFLDNPIFYEAVVGTKIDESESAEVAQMPPCLAHLTREGVGQGFRNQALFNFAVFYKKSKPNSWEQEALKHNREFFSPPMDSREALGVVQSVTRSTYMYLCEQPPIREHCDREACVKLKYGVGHKPWDEVGSFDDFIASNCRKFLSSPPRYIVDVNGKDITLEWDELFQFKNFKSAVGERLNLIIPGLKQQQWEHMLRDLIARKTDIDAPEDASAMGIVVEKFHEFLTLRERASEKEDILKGLPLQVGGEVMFRASDFKRYLQTMKLDHENMSDIYLVLKQHGCRHHTLRVNGKVTAVWAYPIDRTNEQTEAFAVANFKNDFEGEM